MIWLPIKPILHGLGLIGASAADSAPALVKLAEGQHLISGSMAAVLEQYAASLASHGFMLTFCNFRLQIMFAAALLGSTHPVVAAQLNKLTGAGFDIKPPEAAPVAVVPVPAASEQQPAPAA